MDFGLYSPLSLILDDFNEGHTRKRVGTQDAEAEGSGCQQRVSGTQGRGVRVRCRGIHHMG